MKSITCPLVIEKLNKLFERVLDNHPENEESLLLKETVLEKGEKSELVEATFLYGKAKCAIQYEFNTSNGAINFSYNTFKNLSGVRI